MKTQTNYNEKQKQKQNNTNITKIIKTICYTEMKSEKRTSITVRQINEHTKGPLCYKYEFQEYIAVYDETFYW